MSFALDYYVLVFIASCGVIQLAATYSHLRGILFIKNPRLNLLAGLFLAVGPFIWFFASESRNLPDIAGGLDGNQQAGLFVIASASGLTFTLLISSISHLRLGQRRAARQQGLEALQDSSYFWALRSSLQRLWKR